MGSIGPLFGETPSPFPPLASFLVLVYHFEKVISEGCGYQRGCLLWES